MPVTDPLTDAEITQWFDPGTPAPANTFEIALVLGGTVSAGAYTAGALDFLIEALDAWTQAAAAGQPVPRHKTVIRIIAGTSGGGVNAAIAARALAYDFPAVACSTSDAAAASNPFYDIWVNRLDLAGMLELDDLAAGAKPVSMLNGTAIDAAAAAATGFTGQPRETARPYLASPLRLILTLTNLNGIAYRIDFGAVTGPGGAAVDLAQRYVDHADYARFAVVYPGQDLGEPRPDEFVLGFDDARLPQGLRWPDFGQFALGTAAFPVGFPPRRLTRPLDHYRYRVMSVADDTDPTQVKRLQLVPDWPALQAWAGGSLPDDYQFLAVDGGVADNEPIELARTALAGISGRNPRDGMKANRAVVLIDPFAGAAAMAAPVPLVLPDLAQSLTTAVLQQTRYDTRDLLLAAYPDVYSRFMVTALRENRVGNDALATAGAGAFIGFACKDFRRHDYLLGRKNCQEFLRSQFILPQGNPVFEGCLDGVKLDAWLITQGEQTYLPIIPLCGSAAVAEAVDPWPKNKLDPGIFRAGISSRAGKLLEKEVTEGPLANILIWLGARIGGDKIADAAVQAMHAALMKSGLV
jgi:hypothetical protein